MNAVLIILSVISLALVLSEQVDLSSISYSKALLESPELNCYILRQFYRQILQPIVSDLWCKQ